MLIALANNVTKLKKKKTNKNTQTNKKTPTKNQTKSKQRKKKEKKHPQTQKPKEPHEQFFFNTFKMLSKNPVQYQGM